MGKSRFYTITAQGEMARAKSLHDALSCRGDGGFVWLDFTDPTRQALTALVKPLGLHPLAIEDCLDNDQVPKMDEFVGHTFLLFNRFLYVDGRACTEEINLFIGKSFLVSVHSHGRDDPALADRLETLVRRELEQAVRGPDFLLQVILDHIVDEKFDAVEALQDEIDAIEDEVLRTPSEFRPNTLIALRRAILSLRKSLVYEREILVRLCRRDSPYLSADSIYHFRDIYDHLARFFEVIEICRELISSIMEMHLSIINNQMTLAANKTNYVMRRLTMITTIFMPLTLLSGIGGMSEWSMMTGSENWRIAYPAFLLLMILIGTASYYTLKWLDARDRTDIPVYALGDAEIETPDPVLGRKRGGA